MAKAILVPFNPHLQYLGGAFIGTVIPHIIHANKVGGVIWTSGARAPRHHNEIKIGYFYDTPRKAVTYKFQVIRIVDFATGDHLREPEKKFIPKFRLEDIEWVRSMGGYGILMKEIRPLKKEHELRDFIKVSDRIPVKRLQAPLVVIDPKCARAL